MQTLRLTKEFAAITKNPPKGVVIEKKSEDHTLWHIFLSGPPGTPYEGGTFKVVADFTDNYPFKPPKCKFLTKIYHPNIRKENGEICQDVYEKDWVPTKTMRGVIDIFISLLLAPSPESPIEPEIFKEFSEDKEKFIANCKAWVDKYAK